MKIYLATDHAGFALKEVVKAFLLVEKYEVEDCGAHKLNADDDYPDFISKAAEKVSKNPEDKAIIFGGSGQGEAITANKFPHVRSAVFYGNLFAIVRLAREHNDANILSIAGRFTSDEDAKKAVAIFLETPFSQEERHIRRIEKIAAIEKQLHE